jgi:hypothetical protein
VTCISYRTEKEGERKMERGRGRGEGKNRMIQCTKRISKKDYKITKVHVHASEFLE